MAAGRAGGLGRTPSPLLAVKYLLDSNALIYAARPDAIHLPFRPWTKRPDAAISAISRLEVLGFTRLSAADIRAFAAMFLLLPQLPITGEVLDEAVKIRQQFRIKTPDAIVAATALVHRLTLVTADRGFRRVSGLVVIDPLGL